MELFGRKEKIKNQVLNLKTKEKQEESKSSIIKPIALGIAVLAMIVLVAFLIKNTLVIILTAVTGQIGFIVYLAKILEKAQEIKLSNLKQKDIEMTFGLRFKKEEINTALISAGWSSEQVEKAFYEVYQAKARKTV